MYEITNLIDQLIEMEKEQDKRYTQLLYQVHKCQKVVGESSMRFHLLALKELVEKFQFEKGAIIGCPAGPEGEIGPSGQDERIY